MLHVNIMWHFFRAIDENSGTSTATLTASLTDVNDNPPVFSDAPYSAKALQGQAQCKYTIVILKHIANVSECLLCFPFN